MMKNNFMVGKFSRKTQNDQLFQRFYAFFKTHLSCFVADAGLQTQQHLTPVSSRQS